MRARDRRDEVLLMTTQQIGMIPATVSADNAGR